MTPKTRKLLYDIGMVLGFVLALGCGVLAVLGKVTVEQVNYGFAVAFAAYAGLSKLASNNTPKE